MLPCAMMQMWMKLHLNPNDILSRDWVLSYTKACLFCGVSIMREGGCEFLLCSNCQCSFCYNCLVTQKEHGKKCIFEVQYESESVSLQNRAVTEKDTFSFSSDHKYYFFKDRYDDIVSFIKGTHEAFQNRFGSERSAVEMLLAYCDVLKKGYVFGCFMTMSNEKLIYEQNLRKLENEVKLISDMLKENIRAAKNLHQTQTIFDRIS